MAIQPGCGLNLIYGLNGSGKTSILEAISVMAHGRSFRTHKYRTLINNQQDAFTLFAQINEANCKTKIGIERKRSGESHFRLDGFNVNSAANLASKLPLLVINAHSFALLEGSSQTRRQFFDWLVFHVKHEFKDLWSAYRKCIKHRNILLRRDKINQAEMVPWDHKLLDLSSRIDALRQTIIQPFVAAFREVFDEFGCSGTLRLEYQNGWKGEASMEEQLRDSFLRDRKQGYTTLGPHKSDLKITLDSRPAVEILSRGQQKMLISALYLAEAKTYKLVIGSNPVFLLDDMPAELDQEHAGLLARGLIQLGGQAFITGVEANRLLNTWPDHKTMNIAMFHVKHGAATSV